MVTRYGKVFSVMLNLMDFFGLSKKFFGSVANDRVILPTTFPELVTNLHVFVGDLVAVIVLVLVVQPKVARSAIEIG